MRISTKLTLTMMIGVLVIVLSLGMGTFYSARSILKTSIIQRQLETAENIMNLIDRVLFNAYQDIKILAKDNTITTLLEKHNQESMIAKKQKNRVGQEIFHNQFTGTWTSIQLVDRKGKIITSGKNHHIEKPLSGINKQRAYDVAMQGQIYYSDMILSDESQKPTIIFAAPIHSEKILDRPILGVVIAHFSWMNVLQILNEISPSEHAHLFNRQGMVIATPTNDTEDILRINIAQMDFIKEALSGKRSNSSIVEFSHEIASPTLATYVLQDGFLSYRGNNWGLLLEAPLESALAPVTNMGKRFLILMLVLGSLMMTAFYWLAKGIIQPLEVLTKKIETMEYNNLDDQIKIVRDDEIGILADSYNKMLDNLKVSTFSKKYVDNILNSIIDSLIVTYSDKTIKQVNPALLNMLSYEEHELIGQPLEMIIEEEHQLSREQLIDQSDKKDLAKNNERNYLTKDGDKIVVLLSSSVMNDSEVGSQGMVYIARDITERKAEEEALAKAKLSAEHSNKVKSEFLSSMSHEIRTPLNAILGFTYLLRKSKLTTSQSEQLKKIGNAGEHLLILINDILDLSKIEAGKFQLEQTQFNLENLFDSIQSLLNQQFKEKGLFLEVEALDVFPLLIGDPTRLRQALLNYLSNALKFTSSGKVILRVKLLTEQEDKLLLRFEVQDTGIGLEPDKMKHIFQNFEQADSSTTRQYGGTGLGLSITKCLATLMGGDVGVESEINQGSTFWFSACLHRGQKDLSIENSLSDNFNQQCNNDLEIILRSHYAGAHILLVEDNAINQEVAQGILTDVGIVVDTVNNGREALEKIQTTHYVLVLMDVQMPIMDGLEATRCIRAIAGNDNLPVLAMTAGVLDDEKQNCIIAGMNDFVAKPIELNNLFSSLIKWLPDRPVPLNPPLEAVEKVIKTDLNKILNEQLKQVKGLNTTIGLPNLRGDAVAYLRLLRLFESSHGEDIDKINRFLTEHNINMARQLAHTIKGAAGTLGLTSLQEVSKLLEDYLKSHTKTFPDKETARLLGTLTTEFVNIHKALVNIDDNVDKLHVAEPISDVNLAETRMVLEKFEELLKADDCYINTLFLESEQILLQAYGSQAKQLGQQIEMFDYPEALVTLKTLMGS
jgi:PAS domain S-box-containing protein